MKNFRWRTPALLREVVLGFMLFLLMICARPIVSHAENPEEISNVANTDNNSMLNFEIPGRNSLGKEVGTAYSVGEVTEGLPVRRSMPGDQVTITWTSKIYLDGHSTNPHIVHTPEGDVMGQCIEPSQMGTSGIRTVSELNNDLMKATFLTGPGGPYYVQSFYRIGNPQRDMTYDEAYVLQHCALGCYYEGKYGSLGGTVWASYISGPLKQAIIDWANTHQKEMSKYVLYAATDPNHQDVGWIEKKHEPPLCPVNLLLRKTDYATGDAASAKASLKDAEFTCKFYSEQYTEGELLDKIPDKTWVVKTDIKGEVYCNNSYKVSGDDFYTDPETGAPVLPLGTLTIRETKAPIGYVINDQLNVIHIVENPDAPGTTIPYYPVEIKEQIIRGDFKFKKTVKRTGQTLADIPFKITSKTTGESHICYTDSNGILNTSSKERPHTQDTNNDHKNSGIWFGSGPADNSKGALPYDEYLVEEISVPENAHVELISFSVTISTNNVTLDLGTKTDREKPKLRLRKSCSLPVLTTGNSHYSLLGATYEVTQAGIRKGLLTTDVNGNTNTVILEPGTYCVKEINAPLGYKLNPEIITITLKYEDDILREVKDEPIINPIELVLKKKDRETKEYKPQKGASFKDAKFLLEYYKDYYSELQLFDKTPDKSWVLKTDENGEAYLQEEYKLSGDDFYFDSNGKPVIPFGTIVITEQKAPEGYLTNSRPKVIHIKENPLEPKTILEYSVPDIEEQIMRGDLEFNKILSNQRQVSETAFKLTNITSGESHFLMTDVNGYASTASEWALHSENTNAGSSSYDGIWFGIDSNGTETMVNDSLGALPYGKYLLEEQPSSANEGAKLVCREVTIYRNKATVKLGTITDYIDEIEIGTVALDKKSDSHIITDEGIAYINDTVNIEGMVQGEEYTLRGLLIDKGTGQPLLIGGEEVTSEKDFMASSRKGTVEMPFSFDVSALEGTTIVIYEDLYRNNNLIASHDDIENLDQTLYVPEKPEEPKATEPPEEPEEPKEESVPVENETPKVYTVPHTADNQKLTNLIVIMLISCLTFCVCVTITRHRKADRTSDIASKERII
ncbi:MAG: VaFE repeat-containing surface-anchored protein [Lachnospiraceae bacterium]|jgi:hypothetical protein|nr:VaFE repeat-containing surface-anchored protein [Lachnospiraceae bacterium]